MEPTLNCSLLSQSHIDTTLDRLEALGVLQDLCRVSRAPDRPQISAAVQGVLGSLLTCGLLLSLFFFIFTVRFRRNRIVKMSSPNLNLVIVLGSVSAYISAYMFSVQENAISMETVIQIRISLLYIGVTLVFGPLLGKSWRLHRVFTHRVPDKRVIIKDLTLLGIEAGLLFIDSLLLLSWVLSDPVLCGQNVNANIKAADRGTFGAVTTTHFCSSLYADFWIGLLVGFKGVLLVYGSYLAGLTMNISTPPVNQSLAIMVGSSLVIVGTGVVFLVTRFFHTWPSLVYGMTSGSILVCTTTINCLVFIPQLLQWRQFEEEPSQTNVQMAKYFNSTSKSMRSMYSEEQIYHLLGENTSMRRLLTEKNAVIESLQEQVTNAKGKLVQLLKSECSVIADVSALSASTLTIQQHKDTSDEPDNKTVHKGPADGDLGDDVNPGLCAQTSQEYTSLEHKCEDSQPPREERCELQVNVLPSSNSESEMVAVSTNVNFAENVPKSQHERTEKVANSTSEDWERLSSKVNYVSSEKLQEVLRELSVETLTGCGQLSPRRQRRASHRETPPHPTEGFRNACVSLSPYVTRRRRGQGYGRRNVVPSSQYSRAKPPHVQYFINQGARDRYTGTNPHNDSILSHTGEIRLDESNDDHNQPSFPAKNMELHFQAEEIVQENGGLWITKLSDTTDYSKGSSHVINWSHPGADPQGTVNLRSQTPFSESDSSSSEETLCSCHRPYCDICSPNTCESSDSCNTETETADHLRRWPKNHNHPRPVINFTEDLEPTFV